MSHNLIFVKVNLTFLNPYKIDYHRLIELLRFLAGSMNQFHFQMLLQAKFRFVFEMALGFKLCQLCFFNPSAYSVDVSVVNIDTAKEVTIFHLFIQAIKNIKGLVLFLGGNHKDMPKIVLRSSYIFKMPTEFESSVGIKANLQKILSLICKHYQVNIL